MDSARSNLKLLKSKLFVEIRIILLVSNSILVVDDAKFLIKKDFVTDSLVHWQIHDMPLFERKREIVSYI